MASHRDPIKGRGTQVHLANRFEALALEPDPETGYADPDAPGPATRYLLDASRTALASNKSPDIGFDFSLNPYRGCEHGCVYCYARPSHEFLGFSAGIDFESVIFVKQAAPELLRRELSARRWQPQTIAMCGITDAYQPIERRLKITRRCLEVLAEFRNPVGIITKSRLVARDADLLSDLAQDGAASVTLSLTSLDDDLARILEPRAAQPGARLAAVRALAQARVPVGVNLAPIIPGLNEHEIPHLLEAAAEAGAQWASWILLRLPHGVKELFERWLDDHFPERKDKILSRIRSVRGGRLYDSRFGIRQRGEGFFADQVRHLFEVSRRRVGLAEHGPTLSAASFRRPGDGQMDLW